jgi:serine/threonine-protein kinase
LVISQDPVAKVTVNRGSKINLVISQGEVKAIVPDVVGLPVNLARTAISNARLIVGKVTNQNSDRPKGEVLSSAPKSATKSVPGTKVDLVVSNGVALVEVPNVVGLPYPTAYATLTQAGFEVPQPSQEISDKVAPGAVLKQIPAAGERIPQGGRVSIIVAAAPDAQPTAGPPAPAPPKEPPASEAPSPVLIPTPPRPPGGLPPVFPNPVGPRPTGRPQGSSP